MGKADVTKKLLIVVAEDFNKVMELDPPIKSGRKITKDMLIEDLVEAAKEVQKNDILKQETVEVLTTLKIKLPKGIGAESNVKPEEEPEEEPEKEPKKEETEKTPEGEPEKELKEAEIPESIDKTGKEPMVPAKKPTEKAPDVKVKRYTRAQAFCDALQGKPKTIEEIGQEMLELYQKHGSATKHTQLKSVVWAAMIYIHPMTLLELVKKEDQKYSLVK
jgi:hypothetical protein